MNIQLNMKKKYWEYIKVLDDLLMKYRENQLKENYSSLLTSLENLALI